MIAQWSWAKVLDRDPPGARSPPRSHTAAKLEGRPINVEPAIRGSLLRSFVDRRRSSTVIDPMREIEASSTVGRPLNGPGAWPTVLYRGPPTPDDLQVARTFEARTPASSSPKAPIGDPALRFLLFRPRSRTGRDPGSAIEVSATLVWPSIERGARRDQYDRAIRLLSTGVIRGRSPSGSADLRERTPPDRPRAGPWSVLSNY